MARRARSAKASPAARLTDVVVFPTPPFWFTTAMTLAIQASRVPRETLPYI